MYRLMLVLLGCSLLWLRPAGALEEDPGAAPTLKLVFAPLDDKSRDCLVDAVRDFQAGHPRLSMQVVPQQWRAYDIHDTYVRYLAVGDSSVDIYLLDQPWVAEFADPGWLLPLDARLAQAEVEAFAESAIAGGRYRGHLYALPQSLKGNVLFFRKDLLARHALSPPRTLPELLEQARLLREAEGLPHGVALHALYLHNDLFPFFWASGGELLTADGRVLLDSDVNQRTLEALLGLFRPPRPAGPRQQEFTGPWLLDYRAPESAFVQGEAPFLISWTSELRVMEGPASAVRGQVGISPIPGLRGGGASNLGNWYLAVSRFSRHPELALELVRHLTSIAVQRASWTRLGEIPSRRALLTDQALRDQDPHLATLATILSGARPRPQVPNEREVDGIVERALHRAARGELQAGEALAQAAREVARVVRPPLAPLAELDGPRLHRVAPPRFSLSRIFLMGFLLSVVPPLLLLSGRLRRRIASSITARLIFSGVTTLLVACAVTAGFLSAQTLRDQERELSQVQAFYERQMTDYARSLGKNLSLASSMLSEYDASGSTPLRRLMLSSHFSEDLLFLQLFDAEGRLLRTDEDELFLGRAAAAKPQAAPADLPARVRRRSLLLTERAQGDGTYYIEVLVPIFRSGIHFGALRIGVSETRYQRDVREMLRRHERVIAELLLFTLALAAAVVALGSGAIFHLSRRLTAPLEELTRKARRIEAGDLEVSFAEGGLDETGALSRAMAEMLRGLRDRDFIRTVFGRYVTPELAERFTNDPESLRLGGQMQEVTILMSDLRGFTALSEHLGPERTVSVLNLYLQCMTNVITAHGGTINEFLGDGILVLFGAPVLRDDDAPRAARCAIAMQRALAELNRDPRMQDIPDLGMGIAIHSGKVVAGNIGSEAHVKYGVVGSVVNETGRIESLCVGTQVLISAATRERLGPAAELGARWEVQLKGNRAPMEVYELHAISGDPPLRMPAAPRSDERAVEMAASVQLLDGKRVGSQAMAATVRWLSAEGLRLEVAQQLPRLRDLKIEMLMQDGAPLTEIYAKILAVEDVEGGCLATARFTSIGPREREALDRVLHQ